MNDVDEVRAGLAEHLAQFILVRNVSPLLCVYVPCREISTINTHQCFYINENDNEDKTITELKR